MSSFSGPPGIAEHPPDPAWNTAEVGVREPVAEEEEVPVVQLRLQQERHGRPMLEELVIVVAADHDLYGPDRPRKRLGQGPWNLIPMA
jgi:hypothetical protein